MEVREQPDLGFDLRFERSPWDLITRACDYRE